MGMLSQFQKKPDHVKGRYAFLGAAIVTLSIGLIWFTSLPARFATINDALTSASSTQSATISKGFKDLVANTKEQMGEVTAPEENSNVGAESSPQNTASPEFFSLQKESALNNLKEWEVSTITSQKEAPKPILPTPTLVEKPSEVPKVTASTSASTSPNFTPPLPPSKPSVILIGTTTSKKTE